MAGRRRKGDLDWSVVAEEMGVEGVVQHFRLERVLEVFGLKQVMDRIGLKRVFDEFGVEGFAALLSPQQRKELQRLLQSQGK